MHNFKIYLNKPEENWIVDRLYDEWYENNIELSTKILNEADIVWIISPWTFDKLPKNEIKNKKVVCTIHHIDFDKFNFIERLRFRNLDKYVDLYHVISDSTEKSLKKITSKPIWNNPWWIDGKKWFNIPEKSSLRNEFNINNNKFLIGSFQRDTEGRDLKSPKLSKGPDRLIEIILLYKQKFSNLEVVLSGTRRQYLLEKLKIHDIKVNYFELVDDSTLNRLYNILDLYVVSSRVEGGPQAIYECSIAKVPIISTNVGVASKFLHSDSIFDMDNVLNAKSNTEYSYKTIQSQKIPNGFKPFLDKLESVVES